jgi:hypothetical protein
MYYVESHRDLTQDSGDEMKTPLDCSQSKRAMHISPDRAVPKISNLMSTTFYQTAQEGSESRINFARDP